jgi:hypothetical protein
LEGDLVGDLGKVFKVFKGDLPALAGLFFLDERPVRAMVGTKTEQKKVNKNCALYKQ